MKIKVDTFGRQDLMVERILLNYGVGFDKIYSGNHFNIANNYVIDYTVELDDINDFKRLMKNEYLRDKLRY